MLVPILVEYFAGSFLYRCKMHWAIHCWHEILVIWIQKVKGFHSFNPSNSSPIYFHDPNVVILMPADTLTPNKTYQLHSLGWKIRMTLWLKKIVFQNGIQDFARFLSTFRVQYDMEILCGFRLLIGSYIKYLTWNVHMALFYPHTPHPANEGEGGILVSFCLSVCPSICTYVHPSGSA